VRKNRPGGEVRETKPSKTTPATGRLRDAVGGGGAAETGPDEGATGEREGDKPDEREKRRSARRKSGKGKRARR